MPMFRRAQGLPSCDAAEIVGQALSEGSKPANQDILSTADPFSERPSARFARRGP